MNNILKGLIAGYGAKKLGGGCFSMVLIFIIIWWALGQCEGPNRVNKKHNSPAPEAKAVSLRSQSGSAGGS